MSRAPTWMADIFMALTEIISQRKTGYWWACVFKELNSQQWQNRCKLLLSLEMILHERRQASVADRRRFPRGGQRPYDRPGRHPRVIVADSYSGVRRPCVAYLNHFNFLVEEADRGASLIEAVQAEREPPAVVIMDCELADSAVQLRLLQTPQP